MIVALFSCEKDESEYIKIKDVYQGELEVGLHHFTFNMIEAGEFKLIAKLGNLSLVQEFVVRNTFLKADTTNNNPSGSPNEYMKLSLNKSEFLVDEEISTELEMLVAGNVGLSVYKMQ